MGKVLHASYSGWFPTCIRTELPDIGPLRLDKEYSGFVGQQDNPNKKAIDMLMAIFWRVKTWKVYYRDEGGEGQIIEFTGYYGFSGVAEEEDLVCGRPYGGSEPPGWSRAFFKLFNVIEEPIQDAITSEDEYETFRFGCYFAFHKNDDGTEGSLVESRLSGPVYTEVQIADIGKFRFNYVFGESVIPTTPIFEISVHEYWTYGGMYDKTTGLLVG